MSQTDYRSLIDTATWAFIEKTQAFDHPAAVDIVGSRANYDRMCAAFQAPHPPGIAVQDDWLGALPLRHYVPASSTGTVIYLHGGGFVVGGLHSHDSICAEIAAFGPRVVSVDYRLAPEHIHPAAFDDALIATRSLAARFGPVVLVGDSAGAALAASVSHKLRGEAVVRGQVLIYPGLGGDTDSGSYLTHAEAPLLTRADILGYASLRFGGPVPKGDVSAHALAETDFSGLPPTIAFAAECDPLCDDAALYCAAITAAGGQATAHVHRGLVHGWLRARHSVPRAAEAFAQILHDIRGLTAQTS